MSSKLIRVMLLAAMATTTAPAAAIAASEHPVLAADAPEVRVVNNHEQRVRVVLVDEVVVRGPLEVVRCQGRGRRGSRRDCICVNGRLGGWNTAGGDDERKDGDPRH